MRAAFIRAQELCESGRGRPGLPSLISLMVSVDVKQHSTTYTVVRGGKKKEKCIICVMTFSYYDWNVET